MTTITKPPDINAIIRSATDTSGILAKKVKDAPTLNELERHIADYSRGTGDTSPQISEKLSGIQYFTSQSIDPKSSRAYNSYLSILPTYSSKARYVNELGSAISTSLEIQKLYKKA